MGIARQRFLDGIASLPGIKHLRQRRFDVRFESSQFPGACRGVFATAAQARETLPPNQPVGYDHADAAAMYRERLIRTYPSDYPMALWLQRALSTGARRVVDLGGHVGVAYYAYAQKLLSWPDGLSWHVCEVPAVVAAGRALARERGVEAQLSFGDKFSEAEGADVLFISGSLQYMEESLAERLAGLRTRPKWLLVNLLPLHPLREYWTVQSIGTAFCPYRIQQDKLFFDALTALGYRLQDRWENLEKNCWVAFDPEHTLGPYHGAALSLDN